MEPPRGDNLTGLIWLDDANCPGDDKTWQQALDWVDDLNTTSIACRNYLAMTFTDWRLPNTKELMSLVDHGESGPALPSGHPFTRVQSRFYWSSSSVRVFPFLAWGVHAYRGSGGGGIKTAGYGCVWPVRGGQ